MHAPDFSRFRAAVSRDRLPDRIPSAEGWIDVEIIAAFMDRPIDLPTYASFFVEAGYDYVLLQVRGQPIADSFQVKIAEGQLDLHGPEASVGTFTKSAINDAKSFDSYPWIGPQDVYYRDVDGVRDHLPDGMKVVVNCGPIFQFFFRAMGLESLSTASVEAPDLLQAIAEKVGPLCVNTVEALAQREWVGGIWYGDDLAYTTGLLVSPDFLRTYLFPYVRQIGRICRQYDKLLLFHSDGKLDAVMDDLIDAGVQGVHPNEPTSVDMAQMKQRWGDRLSMLGGIDMALLATATPGDITTAVHSLIESAGAGGGIAIGSGNSVAKFIPLANYRAMLDAVQQYGAIYQP